MEIITIKNLIQLAKTGHYPFFNSDEVNTLLKNCRYEEGDLKNKVKPLVKQFRRYRTFERKKLFLQSLSIENKKIFINHLYQQSQVTNGKSPIRYN